MKTNEIRHKFLEYFKNHGHKIVPSSNLVPKDDKTLLFTNAGMVQFKRNFLGLDKASFVRATSSQCCVRAGGKHNDLENVGYTKRHHTFFEMLGNFSFGDYFKKEAIHFAWDFITKELKIPQEKLWVTVYKDDSNAAKIWLDDIGINKEQFVYCGDEANFWSMGAVGPCGPCTEIFYDHGPSIEGGPPGSIESEGDRFVEIWNLVFMEYEKLESGELKPLAMQSVDMGMGLERIAAVMQGVHDNYEIDLFQSLISKNKKILNIKVNNDVAMNVIADHIRSISFLIAEGINPSNEGRGYVLRRIIRRAVRYGNKLALDGEFLFKLVAPLVEEMGDIYPILAKEQKLIEQVIKTEELQFSKTLNAGLKMLEHGISSLSGSILPGELIFKMYDTYGFPIDLIQDIANERKLTLDHKNYESHMAQQKKMARQASKFPAGLDTIEIDSSYVSNFTGYEDITGQSTISFLFKEGKKVETVKSGKAISIVLESTPFYAESGGQVGDTGKIVGKNFIFEVQDTQKINQSVIHIGKLVSGTISLNEKINATVDTKRRMSIKNNHTGTHLVHAALKNILGAHVEQKGSIVRDDKFRFDFVHHSSLTSLELEQIEGLVNHEIRLNTKIDTTIQSLDDAVKSGAMALFDEKYDDDVRVVSVGDFSKELCGGTHVNRTGDIGFFKIINEYSIPTGVRRLEAVTGLEAVHTAQTDSNKIHELAKLLNGSKDELEDKINQLLSTNKDLKKQLSKCKDQQAHRLVDDLDSQFEDFGSTSVLVTKVEGIDIKKVKEIIDDLVNRNENSVVVLVSIDGDKINTVAKVSKSRIGDTPTPSEIVKLICGKGGGRKDMAQGGSSKPSDLDAKLAKVLELIKKSSRVIPKKFQNHHNTP